MKNQFIAVIVLVLSFISSANADARFATGLIDYSNLGVFPYDDPYSVLGKPSTTIKESASPFYTMTCCLAYAAWNLDPNGNKVIATLLQDGHITVEFNPPIYDSQLNWYGKDFIVFGNAFFPASSSLTPMSNMEAVTIISAGVNREPVIVSVSQDGINWYVYEEPAADDLWPTQPYSWDRTLHAWGKEQDWTKPVPPSLTPSQVAGKSIADAIDMLEGSAGGTAFDLSETPYRWIRYIRVQSNAMGEVDGFSRVSMKPTVPGDTNGDEMVDDFDVYNIAMEIGSVQTGLFGRTDFNDDGYVNLTDLNICAQKLGQ